MREAIETPVNRDRLERHRDWRSAYPGLHTSAACLVKVVEWEEEGSQARALSSARSFCPPLLADNPQFHPSDHLAQWSAQHVGNSPEPAYRRIDDTSFHSANIRPIEPALVAEALLRVARLFAEFAHDDPDGFCLKIGRLDLPLALLHGQIRWWYC